MCYVMPPSFSSLSLPLRTQNLCVWSLTKPKSTRYWRRWLIYRRALTTLFTTPNTQTAEKLRGVILTERRQTNSGCLFRQMGCCSFLMDSVTQKWDFSSVFARMDPTWLLHLPTDSDWTYYIKHMITIHINLDMLTFDSEGSDLLMDFLRIFSYRFLTYHNSKCWTLTVTVYSRALW